MYSLTIKRYSRNLNFNTLEELKEELSLYFSPKEKSSGIIEKLTDFNNVPPKDGYIEISYQDYVVCMYP